MDRVSTAGSYSAILFNLLAAEQRQADVNTVISTQKNGLNLKDYAPRAQTLTAMKTVDARLTTYLDQNSVTADRLGTQDQALNQVADAATQTHQAIIDALASGSGDTLMQKLQGQFANAVGGMNTTYDGKFLFAGGQINTQPVTATQLTDLTAVGATIPGFFQNDTYVAQTKLSDTQTVSTGMLADGLGTPMLTAYQTMQAFHQSGAGPFKGTLTAAQTAFLQSQLSTWDQIRQDTTTVAATNGILQNQVDGAKAGLTSQQITVQSMMGGITDADMAKAATDLSQAQFAVQAISRVFANLQNTSLLNVLR